MTEGHQYDMDTVRRVARRLEAAMVGFQTSELPEFVAAATEYAELVAYCNQRLLDAHDRLREGNRSHAIEAVESEPNVLDCVQELDAVDAAIPEWSATFDNHEVIRPARLLTEIADDLGRQYDVKHQLAAELRAHRLLAIGNGSIERRVGVLRRMLALDPENRLWRQDLIDYERHCQAKLRAELRSLSKGLSNEVTRADYERIKAIAKSLADVAWQEPADAAIVNESQAVEAKARGLIARSELSILARKMHEARQNDDAERAMDLLSRWRKLINWVSLPSTDPLSIEHEDVIAWAQRLADERDAKKDLLLEIDSLSALLQKPFPAMPGPASRMKDALRVAQQRVYAAAQGIDESADTDQWLQAASHRIDQLDKRIQSMRLLIAGGVTVAAAATLGIAGLGWIAAGRSAEKTNLIASIDRLCTAGDYRGAMSLVERSPRFESDDEVIQKRAEIAHVLEEANSRRDKLVQLIEEANKLARRAEMSVKELETYTQFDTAAEACGETARTDSHDFRDSVSRIEKHVIDAKDGKYHDVDDFSDDIKRLTARRDEIRSHYRRCVDTLRTSQESQISERLRLREDSAGGNRDEAVFHELDREITRFERLSERTEDRLRDLVMEARKASEAAALLRDVREKLDRASANGPQALLASLREIARPLPKELATTAQNVAESSGAVGAAIAWASAAQTWQSTIFSDRAGIEKWKGALDAAIRQPLPYKANSDEGAQIAELMNYLSERIEGAVPDDVDQLDNYLASKVFKDDVLEVDIGRGEIWYFIKPGAGSIARFVNENEWNDTEGGNDNPNNYISKKKSQAVKARHLKLAKKLRDDVGTIRRSQVCVDEGLLQMMKRLLMPESFDCGEANALLRARLLLEIATMALGRPLIEANTEVQRLQEDLASKVGDRIQWVVPSEARDQGANAEELERSRKGRSEAETILESSQRRWEDVEKNVEQKMKRLTTRPSFCKPLRYIGWADDSDAEASIRLSGTPSSSPLGNVSGAVFAVIETGSNGEPWRLERCGDVHAGTPMLRAVDSDRMFGRPLFLEDATSSLKKNASSAR